MMASSMMNAGSYDEELKEKLLRYHRWCLEHNFPNFLPRTGVCWGCKRQIFDLIHLDAAAGGHTRCGHCAKSYCE